MKGADLKQRDIDRATDHARNASATNLDSLLPALRKTHEASNADISARQNKVVSILKSERLHSDFNSPEKRKHMVPKEPATSKNYGKKFNRDLIQTLGKQDSSV